MKKNLIFSIFLSVFALIIAIMPVFAEGDAFNFLSKVKVISPENDSYTLNLLFKEKYNGNAFIQKQYPGSYYVFIPDTFLANSKLKVAYENKNDNQIVNISAVEKPYIKDDIQSGYVRLSVSVPESFNIQLTADVESGMPVGFSQIIDFVLPCAILVFVFALLLIFVQLRKSFNAGNNSSTFVPVAYETSSRISSQKPVKKKQSKIETAALPKVNIRKNLQNTNPGSFSCFDIPSKELRKSTIKPRISSNMNKTSKVLGSKIKHTNPIKKTMFDEVVELSMPSVDDVLKEQKTENVNKEAELLSVLNITPTKGFYLTTINDEFALFGFVGNEVFFLKKFKDLSQINLQARFYDRQNGNDLYIVRLDSYRAMVEISENSIRETAVL
ncbi:MAG: hypothetical protein LUG16_04535 [Candidatus Gastranaerophilales bacterium]|nr:hypothetical protein [Candidatus Gastranaerophilales bacterium]